VRTAFRQDWPGAQIRRAANATSGSDTRQPAQRIRSESRHTVACAACKATLAYPAAQLHERVICTSIRPECHADGGVDSRPS
jgi:hypothetical protein